MTTLVTGSAGHLGEALMRTLRSRGRQARGLDLKASDFTDRVGTISDRAFVRDSLGGISSVLHAATLHKPHLVTHSVEEVVQTNVTGTRILLEEALAAGVDCFVYTSTTSVYGRAVHAKEEDAAVWISEDVEPEPRNVYGLTKFAAENLCELFHCRHGLPIVVLRTSRFFPEVDDDPAVRNAYQPSNVHANEMLNRRVDLEDAVAAHLLALERAQAIGFGRFIISATTPFTRSDLVELGTNAAAVVTRLHADVKALYDARNWRLFSFVDRVYSNERARRILGWRPHYDFSYVLKCLRANLDFHSELALRVGSKGYHDRSFEDGPYPVS